MVHVRRTQLWLAILATGVRRRLGNISIFLPLLLLAGCTFGRQAAPLPVELSDAGVSSRVLVPADIKINPADSVIKSADQAAAPLAAKEPSFFSLADAIAYARQHNPRLRSARAAIERARGQEQVAFAPFLPQIGILSQSGSVSHNLGPGAPGPTGFLIPNGDVAHQYAQVEAQLQWTLYDFGRTGSRYRQAIARERLAELQMIRAGQTVDFDVAVAYFNVLLTRAYAKVQEEAIQRAEAILNDTKARLKGGVADRDDVLRADVQLSESREALVNAREAEFAAVSRLNFAMGRNAGLPLQVIDLEARPATQPGLSVCLEEAAAERPEIGVARQTVAAAQAGRDARKADFLPRIFARASVGRVEGNGVQTGWQEGAGLHLVMPVYTGGQHQGELQSATSDMTAAIADAQLILDSISLEVNLAYRGMTAAAERIELSRPSVVQAKENLRLVRVKYRNGTATPTDIVDAETSLTRSQQRFFSAAYSYTAALARLAYSMGQPQADYLNKATHAEELPLPRPAPKAQLPGPQDLSPITVSATSDSDPVWRRADDSPAR